MCSTGTFWPRRDAILLSLGGSFLPSLSVREVALLVGRGAEMIGVGRRGNDFCLPASIAAASSNDNFFS